MRYRHGYFPIGTAFCPRGEGWLRFKVSTYVRIDMDLVEEVEFFFEDLGAVLPPLSPKPKRPKGL